MLMAKKAKDWGSPTLASGVSTPKFTSHCKQELWLEITHFGSDSPEILIKGFGSPSNIHGVHSRCPEDRRNVPHHCFHAVQK